jgi:hypothetical protein
MLSVIYVECRLCCVLFTLSVSNKPFMMNVIMLNVVAPTNVLGIKLFTTVI